MMKTQHDIVSGDASSGEIVHDAEIGCILLHPDFAPFKANIHNDVLYQLFVFPAKTEPEIVIAVWIEREAIAQLRLGRWG